MHHLPAAWHIGRPLWRDDRESAFTMCTQRLNPFQEPIRMQLVTMRLVALVLMMFAVAACDLTPPVAPDDPPAATAAPGDEAPADPAPADEAPSDPVPDDEAPAAPPAAAPAEGYLSADGARLVDAAGETVRLTGINWFGLETSNCAPHGLWQINLRDSMQQMADLGFNTLRLPFATACIEEGATANGINAQANPDLVGLSPIEIMDTVIETAGDLGMKVFLDRHALERDNRTNLWYYDTYSEERWISDWVMLAQRYAGNATVIGADLHNEPYDEACWGCGDPALDWQAAAERAGNAILEVNPDWLIIVEGVEESPAGNNWWGGNLSEAGAVPVELSNPAKLVYSPHEYATSVFRQEWFDAADFPDNLPGIWDTFWGYLVDEEIAPLIVGEFGTTLEATEDQQWLAELMAYMDAKGISWTFWSWNPNSGDTGGILNDDWTTINEEKYGFLEPSLAP
jgi:endoglucanase